MIKEESLKDIQGMKLKTTYAKLRNVLYLLQDIEDDKAKEAFKIIDDLIY